MADFARSLLDGFADLDPVIGQLQRHSTANAGPTRNVPGFEPVDHPLFRVEQRVAIPDDVIRCGRLDDYGSALVGMAVQFCRQLTERFVERMGDVAEATGNAIDAAGRPLSHDLILDAIEQAEVDFDDDGAPRMPSVMLNPRMFEMLASMPATDEHRRRYDEIMARKKAAHDAQKRRRRLRG